MLPSSATSKNKMVSKVGTILNHRFFCGVLLLKWTKKIKIKKKRGNSARCIRKNKYAYVNLNYNSCSEREQVLAHQAEQDNQPYYNCAR